VKIKTDFITNSSSSSFIIPKNYLNFTQIFALLNYSQFITDLKLKEFFGYYPEDDTWRVEDEETIIRGSTNMDNFNMYNFMEKIGIDPDLADWGS
jgi:hypothetical protein